MSNKVLESSSNVSIKVGFDKPSAADNTTPPAGSQASKYSSDIRNVPFKQQEVHGSANYSPFKVKKD